MAYRVVILLDIKLLIEVNMAETKELIEQLNERVDKLLTRIAESNRLAEKKDRHIASLTAQLNEKEQVIAGLKAENDAVKAEVQAAGRVENEQLKTRINEMVREIDECISLLKVEN
jgi:hypothetical protein